MRTPIATLLACSIATLSAFAQDPSPTPSPTPSPAPEAAATPAPESTPEATPEPSPESTPQPSPEPAGLSLTNQEFLEIPGEPGQPAEASLTEEEVTLTGEMPQLPESDQEYVDPNALIPADLPATPAPIDPGTAIAAGGEQERQLKVRYREARTKAEKDPSITSLREKAETAKTFEGERAAYREYYRALFRKMRQLDKSLAKKCDLMEKTYLARLAQTRIEPTIPLEPPPKPEPLAN